MEETVLQDHGLHRHMTFHFMFTLKNIRALQVLEMIQTVFIDQKYGHS